MKIRANNIYFRRITLILSENTFVGANTMIKFSISVHIINMHICIHIYPVILEIIREII